MPAEKTNAKKTTLKRAAALELASQSDHLYAAKGKRVVHLDIRQDQPDEATITKLLLGPTGNLRAPTLRIGKTLLVGFDEETYKQLLGP